MIIFIFIFLIDLKKSKKQLSQLFDKKLVLLHAFKKFVAVKRLPKTRSGKVARNTLTALVNGKSFRIPSTIEDPTVYDDLRKELTQAGYNNRQLSNLRKYVDLKYNYDLTIIILIGR